MTVIYSQDIQTSLQLRFSVVLETDMSSKKFLLECHHIKNQYNKQSIAQTTNLSIH